MPDILMVAISLHNPKVDGLAGGFAYLVAIYCSKFSS